MSLVARWVQTAFLVTGVAAMPHLRGKPCCCGASHMLLYLQHIDNGRPAVVAHHGIMLHSIGSLYVIALTKVHTRITQLSSCINFVGASA